MRVVTLYALASAPCVVAFVPPFLVAESTKDRRGLSHQEHDRRATRQGAVMELKANDTPVPRRLLLEGVSTAFAASFAGLAAIPSPALAKVERIKGGGPMVTLDDGAKYQEMTIGDGPTPKDGDRVAVHYSLFYGGLEIESSRDSQGLAARPLGYTCGTVNGPGSVPAGLDECVKGMKVGGRRKIILPPELAFGKTGRPPFIPADATVQFDVSLWSVKPAGTDPNVTLPGSSVF